MHSEENKKSIQDKLANIKYNCDSKTHLKIIDSEKCVLCKEKNCTFICPADVYEYDEDGKELTVQYENCLECGACRISCPQQNIDWSYPSASRGVVYKNS